MSDKKNNEEEIKKQVERINYLAKRLPWIVVIVTVIVAFITLIEIAIRGA